MHGSGLLIVGHGTREPRGVEEFFALVDRVRLLMPGRSIEPCFLELAEPRIEVGLDRLVRQGASRVTVLPLLLFAAGHVRHDIPSAVTNAAARHPRLRVRQASHLGCHPHIIELSIQRYEEALAGRSSLSPQETLLLLVGRGSRDRWATEEMLQFAELRQSNAAAAHTMTCFAAMQRPLLDEALAWVAERPVRRIVVQPHLLFHGYLTSRIEAAVEEHRRRCPAIEWIVTEPLGPERLLAETVAETALASTAQYELADLGRRRPG